LVNEISLYLIKFGISKIITDFYNISTNVIRSVASALTFHISLERDYILGYHTKYKLERNISLYIYCKLQVFITYSSRSLSSKFVNVEFTNLNTNFKPIIPVDSIVPIAVLVKSVEFATYPAYLYSRPSCERASL